MPTVYKIVSLDEDVFELESVIAPATREALRDIENLALVQDASCEYVVTWSGDRLTLWNPELVFGDQARRRFQGSLEEALAKAKAWLAGYVEVDEDDLEVLVWPEEFR